MVQTLVRKLLWSDSNAAKHTIHSIGETVTKHYAEFKAFAMRAEAMTDEGLAWWRKSHWSALIGLGLLILAMVIGDILGIASLV